MTGLVADVGGTNSRLALIGRDGRLSDPTRFANDDFGSFEELLSRFLADAGRPRLQRCCVAVAGPVSGGRARLTNRDWVFDPAAISGILSGAERVPVRLFNDLVALGLALPSLSADQVRQLRPAGGTGAGNRQRLVAGLGTGFNVCAVVSGPGGAASVCEAEQGQASLPSSVAAELRVALGDDAEGFETVEDLFSGRGLMRLAGPLTGDRYASGAALLAAYDIDPGAARAADLFAGLLGRFARELVFQYLPLQGLFLAGGAARGVLGSPARAAFLRSFELPGAFAGLVAQVPVWLIADDAAALRGVATCPELDTGQSPQ